MSRPDRVPEGQGGGRQPSDRRKSSASKPVARKGVPRKAAPRKPASTPPPELPAPLARAWLFVRDGADAEAEALQKVREVVGSCPVLRADDDSEGALVVDQAPEAGVIALPRLGVLLVTAEEDRARALAMLPEGDRPWGSALLDEAGAEPASAAEPVPGPPSPQEPAEPAFLAYLKGYRDAADHMIRLYGAHAGLADVASTIGNPRPSASFRDDERGTWGLRATGILGSRFTGRGVKVAALVDGLDAAHPDWLGRPIAARSFVGGTPTAGGASGTHYLGTALGPARPADGPRYGCAPDALPFVARVLSPDGTGTRLAIVAGIEWSVANGCRVILAPLGLGGPSPDPLLEAACGRARRLGALVIAGAGNNARRSAGHFGFVVVPASCPSAVGVGSIDPRLRLADFSPRGQPGQPGAVALVAPGVRLRSSLPRPDLYGEFSGSSTAASFVAGVAALWAEAHPDASSDSLLDLLRSSARRLDSPASDVGAGLVQAP
ncbi:S8 family serine peptidase [Paludisphaera sp.]|uniref:S8 family serine peptidase n=1 Tax=Paludisphaera sp. TaxID=2017432 RepID=UPI00301E2E57